MEIIKKYFNTQNKIHRTKFNNFNNGQQDFSVCLL